mgnify:CR=1 FL=1
MYIHFENQWGSLLNISNIRTYDCLLANNYESEMCVVQMYKIHEKVKRNYVYCTLIDRYTIYMDGGTG